MEEVVACIGDLSARYGNASVLIDPYQAALAAELLRGRGIGVEEYSFTPASNSELAIDLCQAIRDHTIELPNHDGLTNELLNVQLREVQPGIWRLDHKNGKHDDMAVTTAMAVHLHKRNHRRRSRPVLASRPVIASRPQGTWCLSRRPRRA